MLYNGGIELATLVLFASLSIPTEIIPTNTPTELASTLTLLLLISFNFSICRKDKRVQQDSCSCDSGETIKPEEKHKNSKQKRRLVKANETTPIMDSNTPVNATPTEEVSMFCGHYKTLYLV